MLPGHARGQVDLVGVGEGLAGQGLAAEEPPPAFLQVEPAGPSRNEDVLDARMPFEPGARLQAAMTAEIISDDEDVASWVIGFNIAQQGDVALGIA